MSDDLLNGYSSVMMNGCDQSNNNISGSSIAAASGPMLHSLPAMSGDKGGESLDGVCRDYMRNVCRRGNNCKFRHPDNYEAEELGKQIEYVFCHDYQVSAETAAAAESDRSRCRTGNAAG